MSDCSGYGFGATFTLSLTGKLGDGNYPDLIITATNTFRLNFNPAKSYTVSNWTGGKLYLDINTLRLGGGFQDVNCTSTSVYLTITPDFASNTGTLLLEFRLSGCSASFGSEYPQVFEECVGAGEHVISEMSTYTLELIP